MQRYAILVMALAVAGCGSSGDDAARERTPPPVEETAFGDMAGNVDQARQVEATTLEHKEDLDRAIEQNEKADPR